MTSSKSKTRADKSPAVPPAKAPSNELFGLKPARIKFPTQKRGDLVVGEIKQWIQSRQVLAGSKLPKEAELQAHFGVSKSTIRDALKSLEVQGLIAVKTGPTGGATVVAVPLERTHQFMQNYMFFQNFSVDGLYAVRCLLEPELAAGAVPHLTEAHFQKLEQSIEFCAPRPMTSEQALEQRKEDLHFHDILAEANPNSYLRFMCQMMNETLSRHVVFHGTSRQEEFDALGEDAVQSHREILKAARAGNAQRVKKLMLAHLEEMREHVKRLDGELQQRLGLESELQIAARPPRR